MATFLPTERARVSLRVMELSDMPAVVRLHRLNLPPGFFVELGTRFLSRYYRTYLTSPAAVALVAEAGDEVVGFLVGCTDEAVHRRHVMRLERWPLARAGAASLLVRPQLTARFLRTRAPRYARRLRRGPTGRQASAHGRVGMLSHIAVADSHRRHGVGAALVGAFVDVAHAHHVGHLRLYTAHDNKPAQSFYERLGWRRRPEQTDVDGKRWTPYALDIS